MKKNDTLTLNVTGLTDLGFGVGHAQGMTVFVSDAVGGDTVRAKIIKVNRTYAVARTEEILEPSPERVCDRCENTACRACAYRKVSYEYEKREKYESVKAAYAKAGLSNVRVAPLLVGDKELRYRNKAQYPVGKDAEGNYVIGFYAPKTHTVKEASDCPLAPKVFAKIIDELKQYFTKYDISVYDEETGKGLLRHIYLRRGEVSGEILLTLVLAGESLPAEAELCAHLTSAFPALVGILVNTNKEDTNVILGDRYRTLWGRDYITDTLAGVPLRLSAPSFYQVNHGAAEVLYRRAAELAHLSGSETLLDLYCGAGSIGLSMAGQVKEVIGIEIVESAVRCAAENAAAAGITNAKFYAGDAAETEKMLERAERDLGRAIRPDVIILDPPRKGIDEKLARFTATLSPDRIVYISCNPDTQARDVALYRTLGYTTDEVTPVDLFPMTGHVEAVVLLSRA